MITKPWIEALQIGDKVYVVDRSFTLIGHVVRKTDTQVIVDLNTHQRKFRRDGTEINNNKWDRHRLMAYTEEKELERQEEIRRSEETGKILRAIRSIAHGDLEHMADDKRALLRQALQQCGFMKGY